MAYSSPGHPNDHRDRLKHCQKTSVLVGVEPLDCSLFQQQAEEPPGKKLSGHPRAWLPCILQTGQKKH